MPDSRGHDHQQAGEKRERLHGSGCEHVDHRGEEQNRSEQERELGNRGEIPGIAPCRKYGANASLQDGQIQDLDRAAQSQAPSGVESI